MKLKQLLSSMLVFSFCVFASTAYAQSDFTVSGTVTDADTNMPLPGVNITIQGQPDRGTTTNMAGEYRLRVSPNDVLIFSYIGFIAQESLTVKRGHSEREQVVVRWLKEQLSAYRAVLLELLATEEFSETAPTLCMRLLKAEGERMSTKEDYTFPNQFLQSIVSTLLEVEDDGVRKTYMEEYAEGFDDLRYFTFKSIRSVSHQVTICGKNLR
jgi:hypothetical protein